MLALKCHKRVILYGNSNIAFISKNPPFLLLSDQLKKMRSSLAVQMQKKRGCTYEKNVVNKIAYGKTVLDHY